MTSSNEPDWFKPEPFCREVLNFSFRKLGAIRPETLEDLRSYPEKFKEAVRIVGKAVFSLQMLVRNRLRPLFIESINLAAGVVNGDIYSEISQFMFQGYLYHDIFNFTLASIAILGELILFLDEFGLPIPSYWFPFPWCALYEHRLTNELESNGGWNKLLAKVKIMYSSSKISQEISFHRMFNNRIPYAEVRTRDNWPVDPLGFLLKRFEMIPDSKRLAMNILRTLYSHEELTPLPGDGAHKIRIMLGLEHLNDWV